MRRKLCRLVDVSANIFNRAFPDDIIAELKRRPPEISLIMPRRFSRATPPNASTSTPRYCHDIAPSTHYRKILPLRNTYKVFPTLLGCFARRLYCICRPPPPDRICRQIYRLADCFTVLAGIYRRRSRRIRATGRASVHRLSPFARLSPD